MSIAINVQGIQSLRWGVIQHFPPSRDVAGFCTRALTFETPEGPVVILAFANDPAVLQPQEPAKPALTLVKATSPESPRFRSSPA
jgi:hypothetical protein